MTIKAVCLGYWYQRTTLHLSEVYDFLRTGTSPIGLKAEQLQENLADLAIEKLHFEMAELEFVQANCRNGITFRIYEDGLVTISKSFSELESDVKILRQYFDQAFLPSINYLFSLGAPIPKELAKMKQTFPIFILTQEATQIDVKQLFDDLKEQQASELKDKETSIYISNDIYVINAPEKIAIYDLLETLIFVKEFKAQLHHYLNLHRTIWEKIAAIKDKGSIKGREIDNYRNELEGYKKTIELIDGRLNQMGLYLGTREEIIRRESWEQLVAQTLRFKHKNLNHTLQYIEAIWDMTQKYLDSAIKVFEDLAQQSTKDSIQTLTIISSIGVISGLLGYLAMSSTPTFTIFGIIYLLILILAAWLLNKGIRWYFHNLRYGVSGITTNKDLLKK